MMNIAVLSAVLSVLCLFTDVTGIQYCIDQQGNHILDGDPYTQSSNGWVFSCICNVNGDDACTLASCPDTEGNSHPAGPAWIETRADGYKLSCNCPVERAEDGYFYRHCNSVPQCYRDGQYYDDGDAMTVTSGSWVFNCVCNPGGTDDCTLVSCQNGQAAGVFVEHATYPQYKCVCPEESDNGLYGYFCIRLYSDGKCRDPLTSSQVDPGEDVTKQFLDSNDDVRAQFTCECLEDDSCVPSSP